MGTAAPQPAVFRGPLFWEMQIFLCAICEVYCDATDILTKLLLLTSDRHSKHGNSKKMYARRWRGPHLGWHSTRAFASLNAALPPVFVFLPIMGACERSSR